MEQAQQVKMSLQQFMEFMTRDSRGATFSGLTYFVNEAGSRQDKSYPKFDGKSHKLQKLVTLNATLQSKYQAKINRVLKSEGIEFEWTPNKMTGRSYEDYDKTRAICFKDGEEKTPENAYLVFVSETHTKPKTQYFHLGVPIDREVAKTETFFTPSALSNNGKDAVKNSAFNHALKAAIAAEKEGNISLAESLRENANKLANNEEFKKLEFHFRTVKLTNLRQVNLDGMEIVIEN